MSFVCIVLNPVWSRLFGLASSQDCLGFPRAVLLLSQFEPVHDEIFTDNLSHESLSEQCLKVPEIFRFNSSQDNFFF